MSGIGLRLIKCIALYCIVHYRFVMTPLSVKAPSSKMGVRLKLIYKSTTTVFNILFMFCFILKVMHDFVEGTFLGHPIY